MPKWSALREIFLLYLHGKNVNPLSSTTHWRESVYLNEKKGAVIQIFFSLIYLDRKRSYGRKKSKKRKQPYQRKDSMIEPFDVEKFTIA